MYGQSHLPSPMGNQKKANLKPPFPAYTGLFSSHSRQRGGCLESIKIKNIKTKGAGIGHSSLYRDVMSSMGNKSEIIFGYALGPFLGGGLNLREIGATTLGKIEPRTGVLAL